MEHAVFLFVLLFLKHFVADFVLQTPYQYRNKGILGHPGGLLHALYHVLLTFLALTVMVALGVTVPPSVIAVILVGEFVVHYFIDYAKTNINSRMGWRCNETDSFWVLTGFDQLLHYLTYAGIVVVALG